jgi:hypothetical protein
MSRAPGQAEATHARRPRHHLRRVRGGPLVSVVLGIAIGAAIPACHRDRCAQVAKAGDPRRTADVCAEIFARTGAGAAGLAALEAQVAAKQLGAANDLAVRMRGSAVEAQALVALAKAYARSNDREALAQLARLKLRLVAIDKHAEAATAAGIEARVAWASTDYQHALGAIAEAAAEADRAHDVSLKARARLGMFTLLYELGDVRGARKALEDVGGVPELDTTTRNVLVHDRAMLADAEGHPQLARAAFEELRARPGVEGDVKWTSHLNLLQLALEGRDRAAAEQAWTVVDALFKAKEYPSPTNSPLAYWLYTAELERLRGRPQAALEALRPLETTKPNEDWAWMIALAKGRALEALGKLDAAAAAYRLSAEIVDKLDGDQFDDFKSWVLAQRREPFQALFELCVKRGDDAGAFDVLERVQGRSFVEAFAANEGVATGPVAAPQRITWLKDLYPRLRKASVVAAQRLTAAEVRARLADVQLVSYFEGKDDLFVVVLQKGHARVLPTKVPLSDVKRWLSAMLAEPPDAAAAAELGALLLPSDAGLVRAKPVYVSPSSLLSRLPFGALRRGGRYVAEELAIAQVPGAQALVVLRRAPRPADRPVVILGDAAGDLPQAGAEAAGLTRRFGPTTRAYLGRDATRARLAEATGARLLHIALHSGLGSTGPWLGLADGRLLAGDLLDARIGARLVVLASCASANAVEPGLWGSLAASFLASGSPAVVASLWSTADDVTRVFVERFYDEGGVRDPLRAVTRAQRALIAAHRPVSAWAPFVFFGPGRSASRSETTAEGERSRSRGSSGSRTASR